MRLNLIQFNHLSTFRRGQLVDSVLRHAHDRLHHALRDGRLVGVRLVLNGILIFSPIQLRLTGVYTGKVNLLRAVLRRSLSKSQRIIQNNSISGVTSCLISVRKRYLVEQRLELEGVELEADGADGGDVLGGVLARQQQVRRLHHPRQVAVRRQLQALLLRPRLDPTQALLQPQSPSVVSCIVE